MAEKKVAKRERERIKYEIKKAREEEKTIFARKINIRVGGGLFSCDSNINFLAGSIPDRWRENWNAKLDVQFKFAYLERSPEGKWLKAHTMGLFLNYGKNAGQNVNRILSHDPNFYVDTLKPARGFIEGELGFMFREELRLSGGGGLMNYYQVKDGLPSLGSQGYYCITAGLAPRIFKFMELDLNLSALLIKGVVMPRANLNMVFLIKAGKFR